MDTSGQADLVAKLYDAAVGDAEWSAALCAIAEKCGMENAALVHVDHGLGYSDVMAPRANPEVVGAYNAQWWQHDPTVAATAGAAVGRLTTLREAGRSRFLASAFHNEFWKRSGLGVERIAVKLVVSDSAFVSCVLQTSPRRDEIERAAYDRFAALTPHLIRAVTIQRSLRRLTLENTVLRSSGAGDEKAVVMLDAGCRIVFADEAAEVLLAGSSAVRCRGGKLELVDAGAHGRLVEAVKTVARTRVAGQAIATAGPDGEDRVTIEVLPWGRELRSAYIIGRSPAVIVVVRSRRRMPADERGSLQYSSREFERDDGKGEVGRRDGEVGRDRILDAIKADIREHAADPRLTLAWLGKRHGITSRRIRDLFYRENTNFTEYVMTVRLGRARDMLLDPAHETANIAMIAAQSGFGDLSWFHHVFRRRFGVTPAEMRERRPEAS